MHRYVVPKGSTLRDEYINLVEYVAGGYEQAPRGVKTTEQTDFVLELESAESATFLNGIGRAASFDVLSAEMMQWAAGVSDLRQLVAASPVFQQFSDDGHRLHGAYGPRAHHGLQRAVKVLADDESSRRATVSIWNNTESDQTKDLPCTLSWSFMIRYGALNMTTVMRSNDVWTGVTYDVPSMARIQSMMAWALGVELGSYTHFVQSMHLYDSDTEAVKKLHPVEGDVVDPPFFHTMDPSKAHLTPMDRWNLILLRCEQALAGVADTPEFAWYANRLAKLEQNPHLCHLCRYRLPQHELICKATL